MGDGYHNVFGDLRQFIKPEQLEVSSQIIIAVWGLQRPYKVTELRYFLGLCSVFQQLVPNLAFIAAPFNWKLRRDQSHI